MLDRLPHDLIHHLADLIVPPPTTHNLAARQETCRSLSLLHRTWTAVAQKKLFEAVTVRVPAGTGVLDQRFAFAAARGAKVRRVEVRGSDSAGVLQAVDGVLGRCEDAQQVVLKGNLANPSWELVPQLTSLAVDCYPPHAPPMSPSREWSGAALPSTLTCLSLFNLTLTVAPPPLPHCNTLVLNHVSLHQSAQAPPPLAPALMSSFPSLRVFGARHCPASFLEGLVQDLPPTVEHLLTDLVPWPLVQNERLANARRTSDGKATLQTVTVLTCAGISEGGVRTWFQQLRVWCPLPGTRLETVAPTAEWDLEEWSWSVL
ncbi:hypothetical protein JCM6882_002393 [Rhodosporidiobolus microsporus]